MLLDCADLQEISDEHYKAESSKALFETIPDSYIKYAFTRSRKLLYDMNGQYFYANPHLK